MIAKINNFKEELKDRAEDLYHKLGGRGREREREKYIEGEKNQRINVQYSTNQKYQKKKKKWRKWKRGNYQRTNKLKMCFQIKDQRTQLRKFKMILTMHIIIFQNTRDKNKILKPIKKITGNKQVRHQ